MAVRTGSRLKEARTPGWAQVVLSFGSTIRKHKFNLVDDGESNFLVITLCFNFAFSPVLYKVDCEICRDFYSCLSLFFFFLSL